METVRKIDSPSIVPLAPTTLCGTRVTAQNTQMATRLRQLASPKHLADVAHRLRIDAPDGKSSEKRLDRWSGAAFLAATEICDRLQPSQAQGIQQPQLVDGRK